MGLHSKQTPADGIHSAVAFTYANEAARLAATGFAVEDTYKIAIELDSNQLFLLVNHSPITWVDVGNAAVGQDLNKVEIPCIKASAGTINVGQVVSRAGWDVPGSRAKVELAQSTPAGTLFAVGICSQQITDSVEGKLMILGTIHSVDTSSTVAAPIYLSTTAGAYTNTAPPGPNLIQPVGAISNVDPTEGVIGVNILSFRPIDYSSAPLQAGTADAGTSNLSSPSDHVHPKELVNQQQVFYVGKHGNDANSGKTRSEAFLTFGAAISAAQLLAPSPTNRFAIQCSDAGLYAEDVNLISWVDIEAEAAVLQGQVSLVDDSRVDFRRIEVGAGEVGVTKSSGTGTSYARVGQMSCTGDGDGFFNSGTDSELFVECGIIRVVDGDGISCVSGGNGHVHAEVLDLYISGNGRGLTVNGGKIYCEVQEIEDIGTGTTTGIDILSGSVRVSCQNLECDTAYSVAVGASLYALFNKIDGTQTNNGTANVTVAGAGGGEANTASNQGAGGVGVFKQKTGADLEFKNINAGSSKVSVTDDTGNDEVDIDVVESNLSLANIGGSLAGDSAHGNRGGGSLHADATTGASGFMSAADKTKLDGLSGGSSAIFGDDYQYIADDSVSTTTSSSFQTKLPLLTPTLTGTYRVNWSARLQLSTTNGRFEVELYDLANLTRIGPSFTIEPKDSNNQYPVGTSRLVSFSSESKNFAIRYRRTSGTATIDFAKIEIWRVS